MESESTPRIPALRHYWAEIALIRHWVHGRFVEKQLAHAWPGDGRPIIVIPGLFTTDARTRMLRRVLQKAGYRAEGWGLGRNMPVQADILDRFGKQVQRLRAEEGQKVTLIGWSLGGLIARAYAHHQPDDVAGIMTLGSPFSGNPRSNRAWQFYEMMADHKVDNPPLPYKRQDKPPVPTLAIWSGRDGVIHDSAARGLPHERDDHLEIRCGHFSMASAPDALEAVLQALRSDLFTPKP